MNILRKLLWKKSHRSSSLIAGIGLAVGMWILLLSLQGIIDFRKLNKGKQSTLLSINKSIGLLNTFGMKNSFGSKDLKEIESLEGIVNLAAFRSNDFKVSIRSERLGFSTEIFFESLPSDFLKELSDEFEWSPSSSIVPIVLPRQYISLYNFGFAPSQGLPQVSPGLIQRFTFDIMVRGKKASASFKGKIVDLTDDANTVLVPDEFLRWANEKYGSGKEKDASRLAILCEAENIPLVRKSIDNLGFEISKNQLVGEKAGLIIQLSLFFILLIGLLFLILAGFLVFQSLKALISGSSLEIKRLFEFGKSPEALNKFYQKATTSTILIGIASGVLLFLLSQFLLKKWIIEQGIEIGLYPNWAIIVLILIIGLLFYTSVLKGIRSQLQSNFP